MECHVCGGALSDLRKSNGHAKVHRCSHEALPGMKVCAMHVDRQCPAMHGYAASGVTLEDARLLGKPGPRPRGGPKARRQCWNVVRQPGTLCWRHKEGADDEAG